MGQSRCVNSVQIKIRRCPHDVPQHPYHGCCGLVWRDRETLAPGLAVTHGFKGKAERSLCAFWKGVEAGEQRRCQWCAAGEGAFTQA